MSNELSDFSKYPFPVEMNEWLEELIESRFKGEIGITLIGLYFEKLLEHEWDVRFPKLNVFPMKRQLYSGRSNPSSIDMCEQLGIFLTKIFMEHTSFSSEEIDLTELETYANLESDELLGTDDTKRKELISQYRDDLFTQAQRILYKKLPEPVIDSFDYGYGRRVIYFYSKRVAAYMSFATENQDVIKGYFQEEHMLLLQAIEYLKYPLCTGWVKVHSICDAALIIGFPMGSDMEDSVGYHSYDYNFFIAMYIAEKLLDLAGNFFSF